MVCENCKKLEILKIFIFVDFTINYTIDLGFEAFLFVS